MEKTMRYSTMDIFSIALAIAIIAALIIDPNAPSAMYVYKAGVIYASLVGVSLLFKKQNI